MVECGISDPRSEPADGSSASRMANSHIPTRFFGREPDETSGSPRLTRVAGVESLATQSQALDQRPVACDIATLEIVQQSPTLAHDIEQATPRVVILLVGLKMVGQLIDASGQQRNLNFRRSGVAITSAVAFDDLLLQLGGDQSCPLRLDPGCGSLRVPTAGWLDASRRGSSRWTGSARKNCCSQEP